MKLSFKFILLALIIFMSASRSYSQTRQQLQAAAGDVIDGILKTQLGPQYESVLVIDVDSVLGNRDLYLDPIEDPYGTLRHCFIFTGGRDDKEGNFVGIYKDNKILWRSDTTIHGSDPKLFTAEEMTRSNEVDLVFESDNDWQSSQLWIFSWDGHSGKRINSIDSQGESVLQSVSHSFELVDANGDGIIEIVDGNVDDGSQSWSWNGTEYGSYADTPHLPSTTLWPRNKVNVTVSSAAKDSTVCIVFNYAIYNKPTSIQNVNSLRVWGRCDSTKGNSAPAGWIGGYNLNRGGNGAFFSYWQSNVTGFSQFIRPGQTGTGFVTIASGLPAIVAYDAQGANAPPNYRSMTDQQRVEIGNQDGTANSVHGLTIAPVDPPMPFVPLDFLDTITNYATQSAVLGWIDNQGIANSLDQKLDNAKMQLQKADTTAALNTLRALVNEVEAQNGKHLSSEAYALLKYNAEFLISKL